MKQILTTTYFLLLFHMSFSLAQTAPSLGSGTTADPYQISDYEHLLFIGQNESYWKDHYVLTADIDASPSATPAKAYTPIGRDGSSFKGSLNGNNFTISNLTISLPTTDYVGMFGNINESTSFINNLVLEDFDIEGQYFTGALVGRMAVSDYVSNITLKSSATGTAQVKGVGTVGGMIGQHRLGNITNITVEAIKVESDGDNNVGGLAGVTWNEGGTRSISNIFVDNTEITSNANRAGGVIGRATKETIVTDVEVNNLVINAVSYAGGVMGQAIESTSITTAVLENININVTSHAGGVIGQCQATNTSNVVVKTLDIVAEDRCAGGIVGKNDEASTVQYAMASGKIKGKDRVGGIVGDNNNGSSIAKTNAIMELILQTDADRLGGIVGGNFSLSTVTASYAVSTVTDVGNLIVDGRLGGVAGSDNRTDGGITDTYFDQSSGYMNETELGIDIYDITLKPQDGINPISTLDFELLSNFNNFSTDDWVIATLTEYDPYPRPYSAKIENVSADLPVELIAFYGEVEGDKLNIKWITATELNNDFFLLEYSYDQKKWERITEIEGNGSTQLRSYYEYQDSKSNYGSDKIFYRLKQVDFDGNYTFYYLELNLNQSNNVTRIYPTITDDIVNIIRTDNSTVSVFNQLGKEYTAQVGIEVEQNLTQLSLSQLPKGWYFIKTYNTVKRVYRK
ncbi:hypothetical protein [Flammeovirga aprica]|uniref:Secretion system C-terminal sorting domain-containing protein n=1 Tax=Flammeovirga aprica JL-4 TaxID=694437 RepID=A0A7X9XBQ3_9BACT|nr:hypothetical protein [Flammeovirga aprica]NME70962.1 hypothetical protein [Flammeovirga aprica JL-4]